MILDSGEKKRRRLLRVAGVRDEELYIGPEVVHLHITNRCNLRCRYCWYHSPHNPIHDQLVQDLSLRKFYSILTDCLQLKVNSLYISGEGEPTLHPQFAAMMGRVAAYPFNVTVFTNAAFVPDFCVSILQADRVIVDLSAADRQTYRLLQGGDYFDRVIENIKTMARMRRSLNKEFTIQIVCVINRHNVGQMKDISALMKSIGVDQVDFVAMQEHEYNHELVLREAGDKKLVGDDSLCKWCGNGWFYASVRLDGKMSYCCQIDDMYAAHLRSHSLKTAWSSKRFMDLRLLGKRGKLWEKFSECSHCRSKKQNLELVRELARLRKK